MVRFGQWSLWFVIAVAFGATIAFSTRMGLELKREGIGVFRRWLRISFGASGAKSEDPAVEQQVIELLNERRTRCAQAMVLIIWGAFCLHWTKLPMQLIFIPGVNVGNVIEQPGWETEMSMAFATIAFSVAGSFPGIVKSVRGRQIMYCVIMANLCALVLMPVPANEVDQRTAYGILGALTFAVLDLQMRTIILPTLCLLVCLLYSHSRLYERIELWLQTAYVDCACFSIVLLTLYLTIAVMKTSTRNEVVVRAGERQQSAVSSLLEIMCDAVVDLDEHGRLKEHDARLAVMLMHGSGRSLQGEKLSVFMGDDDSRQCLDSVLSPPEQSSPSDHRVTPKPRMMSVRLRESMGSRIRVVAYHVPHVTLVGDIHHLIGMREETDFSHAHVGQHGEQVFDVASGPEAELRPELALRLQQIASRPGQRRAPPSLGRSSRSSRSSDSDEGADRPNVRRSAEIYLGEGLPIRWSAEDLKHELGIPQCEAGAPVPLLGDLMTDGGPALLKQLQDMVDSAASYSTEANFVRRLGQWEFKPSLLAEGSGSSIPIPSGIAAANPTDGTATSWRSLWVNFFVPVKKNERGIPFLAISIGRDLGPPRAQANHRRSGSSQRGTAASSTPQAFSDVRRLSSPAAMVTL